MIGYLSGKIVAALGKYVLVDVNGVGYRVTMPSKNLNSISKIGSFVKLYTHHLMNPRDGSVELYGFTTPQELNFFELLTSVSGVGPKSAQAILSTADLRQLQLGIAKGDEAYLCKVAGIGQKTAQRLVLELKNKLSTIDLGTLVNIDLAADTEAIDALVALGYPQAQARETIRNTSRAAKTSEEKVGEALKILGSKGK